MLFAGRATPSAVDDDTSSFDKFVKKMETVGTSPKQPVRAVLEGVMEMCELSYTNRRGRFTELC